MGIRFTVLSSGSGGNASVLETDRFGLLIDAGLTGRELTARLDTAKISWDRIHAMLLTHTHGDHWNDGPLGILYRSKGTLYCNVGHVDYLRRSSRLFPLMEQANQVQFYQNDVALNLAPSLNCLPIAVRHDSGPTYGFRLEASPNLFGDVISIGYASDLGCWDDVTADALANVDVLAIEYNHDVRLQNASRRPRRLIRRVLGNEGHLSNLQAAQLTRAVLERSDADRLQHLVQLHLSRECNRQSIAVAEAATVLDEMESTAKIHTGHQHRPLSCIRVDHVTGRPRKRRASRRSGSSTSTVLQQLTLPGMGE